MPKTLKVQNLETEKKAFLVDNATVAAVKISC